MRKSLAAAVLLVGALAPTVAAVPAQASTSSDDLCMTVDATPAYEYSNFTAYQFTLSAGRGFRFTTVIGDSEHGNTGYRGHGAEHPDHEVWVRAEHLSC
jgi:hypothetical protein